MTEKSSDADQNVGSEDIATLYSQANMEGSRYWDFSESRKKMRGQFHHRMALEQAEQAGTAQRALPPLPAPAQFPAPRLEPQARSVPSRPASAPLRETPASPPERGRWFGLQSDFSPPLAAASPSSEPQMAPVPRPPMVAVFSLAGGVGKTCLVATLGRALSAMGEQVLLTDTAAFGLMPFYFGSRESKPGVVRTFFSPPSPEHSGKSETPVNVLSLTPEDYPGDGGQDDPMLGELVQDGREASRILIDIATGSRQVVGRLLRLRPTVLVPLLPDMSSWASLASLEALFAGKDGEAAECLYLLNQFDAALPLHQEIHQRLQQQLGDRLLPLVMRRNPVVNEALAEGMTVIDYAPGSTAAEDYWALAAWLRSFAAPAIFGHAREYSGVRWSER